MPISRCCPPRPVARAVEGSGDGLARVEGADLVGCVLVQEGGGTVVEIGLVGCETGVGLDRRVVGAAVAVGAVRAVARHRAVDDLGVQGPHRLVAQAQPVDDPGSEVLNDHVGRGGECHHNVSALVGSKVDGDAPFPSVAGQVERAHAVDRDADPTCDVTDPRVAPP